MIFGPYPATVIHVYDGDTATLDIDLGFSVRLRARCRAYGINAPELKAKDGLRSKAYAKSLCLWCQPIGVRCYGNRAESPPEIVLLKFERR